MKLIRNLFFFGVIIYGTNKFFSGAVERQEKKIKELSDMIAQLKQVHSLIKFKILRYDGLHILVSLKFFDYDGNEVARQRFSLTGHTVSIDFVVVELSDKRYIAFPAKLFSDAIKPAEGVSLFDFYDQKGFPAIMRTKDMDDNYIDIVSYIFSQVRTGNYSEIKANVFGNMVQPHPGTIKEGDIYSIKIHTKGGLEIIQDYE